MLTMTKDGDSVSNLTELEGFLDLIEEKMQKENVTRTELAKRMKVTRAYVSQMFNKRSNLTQGKMFEVAEAMGLVVMITLKEKDKK